MTRAKGHLSPDSINASLTRRAALIGLAVVATPVTSSPVLAADHPDAELLKAGAEFDRTAKLFADAQERSRPYWEAWEAALKKKREEIGLGLQSVPDEWYEALDDELSREYPIAFPTCDDVADMMDVPMQAILALPARTAEGLAVKAQVVRWHYSRLWQTPFDDLDLDDRGVRSLVEAVEGLGAAFARSVA
jgi:hypothetical protein